MITISTTYCFYEKKRTFVDPCELFWSIFARKKLPTAHCFNIEAHIGICAQISKNTLLYLPNLKRESPILLLMLISLDWQFQEHSIVRETLTKLFMSNIINHYKSHVKWLISIYM